MQAEPVPKDKIDQFISITGASKGQASFYLEASSLDVASAVDQYFSTGGNSSIQTLNTLNSSQDSTMSQDDNDTNEYYAGGNNKQTGGGSGQNVLGPRRSKRLSNKATNDEDPEDETLSSRDKMIKNIYKKAREAGGKDLNQDEKSKFFGGFASNLRGENNQKSLEKSKKEEPTLITLKHWENGFSVDVGDVIGHLRDYNNPKEKQFLAAISKGEIPNELVSEHKGGELALNMEDHRDEKFKQPPKPKYIAFGGSGNSMTNVTQRAETSSNTTIPENFEVNVDDSKPITKIAIRLCSGRLVQKFNTCHTIGDIRKLVSSKSGKANFKLMSSFPQNELTDDNLTIAEAGLENSSLLQR